MLPTVDLTTLDDPAELERFREVTHTTGFFYLTGHHVDPRLVERVQSTSYAFFALPEEDKRSIDMSRSPHFRGYTKVGGELTNGAVDWREQVEIGPEEAAITDARGPQWLRGPNLWPPRLPALREVTLAYQEALAGVGLALLRSWAVSLGAPRDLFDAAFTAAPTSVMKLVYYPPRPADVSGDQGVGSHKDPGVLTLLLLEEGSAGLEVQDLNGRWLDAPPVPGAFVVNIGELLEYATGGYLRATPHRVRTPAGAPERLSIPYFFGPALDAKIPTVELPAHLAAQSRGITVDPANELFETYGDNFWKAKRRTHPEVFERWHGRETMSAGQRSSAAT